MRSINGWGAAPAALVYFGTLVAAASSLGCRGDVTTPTGKTAAVTDVPPLSGHRAATIVYTSYGTDGSRAIYAVPEDASAAPVRVSRPGGSAVFAGCLPGRRVIVAALGADGSLTDVDVVGAEGDGRATLGTLPAGRWKTVDGAKVDGDVVALELGRLDASGKSDVVALRSGTAPVVLAENATLVGAAAGRIAFKTAGSLKSVRATGGDAVDLGGGDGQDHVLEVRGDRLLVTLHDGGSGDVRIVRFDGSDKVDLGTPTTDDRAFAFAGSAGVVTTRATPTGRRVLVTGVDGQGERAVSPAGVDATPLSVTPEGDVLFGDTGALRIAPADGGAARTLDAAAGSSIHFGAVVDDRAFFTGGEKGGELRTAKLDGSGATQLVGEPTWLSYFSTRTPGGRVVFYRALIGQVEGGRLYSVALDGTDRQPVAEHLVQRDGSPLDRVPADQDFEAVTPSGRVVLEAEFDGTASHLLVTPGSRDGRRIADQTNVKFAALVTE